MNSNSLITTLSTAIFVGTTLVSVAAKAAVKNPVGPQTDISAVTSEKSAKTNTVANDATVLTLGKIETEVENDLTLVTAKLNKHPDWKNLEIEDHGTFIQVKLPATAVISSGEFFDGNGPYLKKIASFQVGESDGALRLFLNQDAAKAKLATTAELLGERIVITIDHKKLEQLIHPVKENTAKKSPAIDAVKEESLVSTEANAVSGDSKIAFAPEPPKTVTGAADSGASKDKIGAGPESLDLKDKLITAAGFCAVMLLLLLGSTMWRNKRIKLGKVSKKFDAVDPAPMKVLSNLSISGRQRLSLVQVGSQQILIGVSPDNISFLTEVHARPKNQPSSNSFGNHLLNADPNAEVKLKQASYSPTANSTAGTSNQKPTPKRPAETTSVALTTGQRPVVRTKQVTGQNRINYAVGDEGVSDLRSRGIKNDKGRADQPFDDITKVIRDRLKNLPPVP